MALDEKLSFILQLDDRGAVRAFGQLRVSAERELGAVDNRLDRIGSSMQRVGAGAVAFAGVAGRALFGFAKAAEEAEAEQRKLDLALRNAPQLAGESAERFTDLADALQDTTRAEGDAIVGLEGFLGTLGRTGDEIVELTPLIVDLARRYGLEFEAAGRLVNNAVEGNGTRLERLIGQIGDTESVADALRRTVGGFAEQEAQSLAGQLDILKNNLGDVAEGMGVGVVGAFNDFLFGPAKAATEFFTETSPQTQEFAGRIAAIGTGAVAAVGGMSLLAGSAIKMRRNFVDATGAVTAFGRAAQFAGIAAATASVAAGISSINDEAERMAEQFGTSLRSSAFDDRTYADWAENLGIVERSIAELNDELTGTGRFNPFDADLRAQIRRGIDELEALRDTIPKVDEKIRALAEAEGISLDAATRRVLATVRETDEFRALADAVGEETAETLLNSGVTDDNTVAQRRNAEKLEARRAKIEDVIDAQRRLSGEERSVTRATLDRLDAEDRVRVVSGEATATDRDRERALLDLQDAYEAEGEAVRREAETQAIAQGDIAGAAEEGARRQIEALLRIAGSLEEGSPVRLRLEEYINRLIEAGKPREAVLTIREERIQSQDEGRQQVITSGKSSSSMVVNVDVHGLGLAEASHQIARDIAWKIN